MRENTLKLLCALLLLAVSVQAFSADAPGTLYSQNFATGGAGWASGKIISSSPNSWRLGVASIGYLQPYPWYCWGTARDPVNPYTNALTGGYYAREYSYVKSPSINLSSHGIGHAVTLNWMDYMNIHSGSGSIEVSNNYGLTWKQLYKGYGDQTVTGSWRTMSGTLGPTFCTMGFRVRFRIDSYAQAYTAWQGFYFDNVSVSLVTATGSYDLANAYTDDGGWVDYPGPMDGPVILAAQTYDDNIVTLSIMADTTAYMDGEELTDGFYGPWYEDYYYEDAEDFGIPNPDDVVDLVAYGVGDDDETITFDNPVRLQFDGQAGKLVGWYDVDLDEFHLIDTMLEADDGSLLGSLGVDAGYLDIGDDLVVWTDHMTYFVMYVPEPAAALLLVAGSAVLLVRRRRRGTAKY
ncbi:MAG: PEP-CTERM sorting domain-containing protein [Phycisphaerae bacterium]|nr:PEP-CTERM sorting domain-containing protein [Phycisphaerae bacterium]